MSTSVTFAFFIFFTGCLLADEEIEFPAKAPDSTPPAVQITFSEGSKVGGQSLQLVKKSHLRLHADNLHKPADFKLDQVRTVEFLRKQHSRLESRQTLVYIHPRFRENHGDVIAGTLKEINKDAVVLETPYAGALTIARKFIHQIKYLRAGNGYYYGPSSGFEWSCVPENSWRYHRQRMESIVSGQIGRDVNLQALSHVSFKATWKSSMRFKLQLYASNVTKESADAYYELTINRSYAYMRTRGKIAAGAQLLGGGRWKQLTIRPDENQAQFDVFTNRKTGLLTIYINGSEACQLNSQNPDPKNLGTGLSFVAEDRYPITISDISVSPWDGVSYPKSADEKKPEENKPAADQLHTIDGRSFPFQTAKVTKKHIALTHAKSGIINIPLDEFRLVTLPTKGEEPKKYRNDVRAWFQHGGYITLNLKTLENGKISGFHQALGNVTLDLAAISYIEFNIHQLQYNEKQ